MSKITTDDDDFEIDDADDSELDDLDFGDGDFDDMMDMEDNREPLHAFASGVIKPFKLQDNKAEIFGTIARNALPKSYGEAFDEASSLKYTASSLFSEATAEAAPALKAVKTLAKKLLPTNSKFVPSFISKKVKQFTTEEDEDRGSSGHTSYDPDSAQVVSTLQTIFGAERIQRDLDSRRDQIKENVEKEVEDDRYIETTSLQKNDNYWLSRLVNYQDNVTDKYLRKSLELQHLSFYALRDILQYSRTGGENTIELLKGILKNTGLPNEVKVTNSEILGQVSKEHLSGIVSNGIRNKLGDLPRRISENLSRETKNFAGMLGQFGNGITDQLNDDSSSYGPNPFEQQGEFVAGMGIDSFGGWLGKKFKTSGGKALKSILGESRANKFSSGVEAGGLRLNRYLRDAPAMMNRKMDEAGYGDGSIWSVLSNLVGSVGSNDEAVTKKLHDNINKPATWDILSRKTLVEIIPGFLSRQLEQLTLISHHILGKDTSNVSRVIYSTKDEGFTTMKEEVEKVKKSVKSTIRSGTKDNVEAILEQIDPNQELSKEDRVKIGLKLIEAANMNHNFDPKDLLDSTFLYDLSEPEKAEKVFKEAFDVTEVINRRTLRSSTKYGSGEEVSKRRDLISEQFGKISSNVGDYSKIVADSYDTGNKDVLTESGVLNQYGYIDPAYKQKLLREMLDGMVDPRFIGPMPQISSTATPTANPIINPASGLAGPSPTGPSNGGLVGSIRELIEAIKELTSKITGSSVSSSTSTTTSVIPTPSSTFSGLILPSNFTRAIPPASVLTTTPTPNIVPTPSNPSSGERFIPTANVGSADEEDTLEVAPFRRRNDIQGNISNIFGGNTTSTNGVINNSTTLRDNQTTINRLGNISNTFGSNSSTVTSNKILNRTTPTIDTNLINHYRSDGFIGPRLPAKVIQDVENEETDPSILFNLIRDRVVKPASNVFRTRVLGDTSFSEEDLDRFLEEGEKPDKFEDFLYNINTLVSDIKSSNFVTENKAKIKQAVDDSELVKNAKDTINDNAIVKSVSKKKDKLNETLEESELSKTIQTVLVPTITSAVKDTLKESQKLAREILYNQEDTTITKDIGIVGRAYNKAKSAYENRNVVTEDSKLAQITSALEATKNSFKNDTVIQPTIASAKKKGTDLTTAVKSNKTLNLATDYLDSKYNLFTNGIANIRPLPESSDKRYTSVYKPKSNKVTLADVLASVKAERLDSDIPNNIKEKGKKVLSTLNKNERVIKAKKLLTETAEDVLTSEPVKKINAIANDRITSINDNEMVKDGKKYISNRYNRYIDPRVKSIQNNFITDEDFVGPKAPTSIRVANKVNEIRNKFTNDEVDNDFVGPRKQSRVDNLRDKSTDLMNDVKDYDYKENPIFKSLSTVIKEIPTNISNGFQQLTNPETEIDKPLNDFQVNTLRLLERMATSLDSLSIVQQTNTSIEGTEKGINPTLMSRTTEAIKKSWVGKAATPFIWTGGKALSGAKNFLKLGTALRKITKPVIGFGLKVGFGAIKPIAKLGLKSALLAGKLGLGAAGLAARGLIGGLIKAPGRMLRLGKGVGKLIGGTYRMVKKPLKAGLDLGWRGAKGLTKFTGKTIAKIPGRILRGGARLGRVANFTAKAVLSPFKILSDIYGLGEGIVKAPFKALNYVKNKILGNKSEDGTEEKEGLGSRIMNKLRGKPKVNPVVTKLDEIFKYLKKAVPIRKVDVEAATNDRIGGVNDLIRRRAANKKAKQDGKLPKEDKKVEDKAKGTDGLLSDLGDMAKSVGGLIVGFLGAKLATLFGGLGGLISKIPLLGTAASVLGFGGAGAAGAGAVAAGEVAVAGAGAATAGAGLGVTIMGGLGTAATAFATFSNPIGWAVLAGATAYAGYKAYKYLKRKASLENLELLRFLQYGIPVDNTDAVTTIRKLEEEFSNIVSIDNSGKPKIDKTPEEIWESYYEMFGCAYENLTHNKNFLTWFYKRFVPIFIKHKVVLKQLDKNADLLSIDDYISPKSNNVFEFVNRVQFGPNEEKVGLNPYSITVSPWNDIALADNKSSIEELSESLKNSSARGTNEKADNLKSIKPIAPVKEPKDLENDRKRTLTQANFKRMADAKEEAKKEQSEEKEQSFFESFLGGIKNGTDSLGKTIGGAAYDAVEGIKNFGTGALDSLKGIGQDIGSGMYDAVGSVQNAINSGKDLLVGNKGSAKLMMKILMEKGWTKAQAAGLAANVAAESGFRIDALGDSGKAYGIAQWHPDRQLNFKKVFHKDIRESRFEEQVAFLDWELNNNEKKAGNILRTATDPAKAAAIVEQKFERSSLGLKGGVQPERVNAARGYFNFSDGDIQNSSDFSSKVLEHGKDIVGLGDTNFKGVPLSDLPIKSAEATAGGPARDGTMKLASATMGTFGDDIKQFTAFNDAYHQKNSPKSMHTKGLAFDISLKKPSDSQKITNGVQNIGEKAGVELNVINEYINPSAKSTGGHVHVNFKTLEDSEKFSRMYSGLIPDGSANSKPIDSVSSLPAATTMPSKTSPFIQPAPSSGLIPMAGGSDTISVPRNNTVSESGISAKPTTSVNATDNQVVKAEDGDTKKPETSVIKPSVPTTISETIAKPPVKNEEVVSKTTVKKDIVNTLDSSMDSTVDEKDTAIPTLKNNKFEKVGLRSSLTQSVLPASEPAAIYNYPKTKTQVEPSGLVSFNSEFDKPKIDIVGDSYRDTIVTPSKTKYDIANPVNDLLESVRTVKQPIENPAIARREPKVTEPSFTNTYEPPKPVDLSPLIEAHTDTANAASIQRSQEIALLQEILETLKRNENNETAKSAPQSQILVSKPKEDPRVVRYPVDLSRKN